MFDAFAAAVDRTGDPGARALLAQVLELYALTVIEGDRAFFIEHSYLTPGRAKAVTQAVNALCGQLRPHARTLVDGFGIPEPWLACPLLDGEQDAGAPMTDPSPSREEPTDLASVG